MITGSVSSAVAVAGEKLAQRKRVLNMASVTASNATTGKDCVRYSFQTLQSAYMVGKALAPVLAKEIGANKKAAYLVPDYTYGHITFNSMNEFLGKHGWTVVMQQVSALATRNYSSYLLNIANSAADVFVNIDFGDDFVASTKQAGQFGILKKMKYVCPIIAPFAGSSLGTELVAGMYGTRGWTPDLAGPYPLSKDFLDSFRRRLPRRSGVYGAYGLPDNLPMGARGPACPDLLSGKGDKALEALKFPNTTLGEVWY